MPQFPDDLIRAILEADGVSLADYILFGEEGKTVICFVNREGIIGAVADDDDDRARASVAYLTKMKASRCATFEEVEALVRSRKEETRHPKNA